MPKPKSWKTSVINVHVPVADKQLATKLKQELCIDYGKLVSIGLHMTMRALNDGIIKAPFSISIGDYLASEANQPNPKP